jgi:hypothetical protein
VKHIAIIFAAALAMTPETALASGALANATGSALASGATANATVASASSSTQAPTLVQQLAARLNYLNWKKANGLPYNLTGASIDIAISKTQKKLAGAIAAQNAGAPLPPILNAFGQVSPLSQQNPLLSGGGSGQLPGASPVGGQASAAPVGGEAGAAPVGGQPTAPPVSSATEGQPSATPDAGKSVRTSALE